MQISNEFQDIIKEFYQQINSQINFLLKQLKRPELPKPENVEAITLEFILKSINRLGKQLNMKLPNNYSDIIDLLGEYQKTHEELSLRRLDVHHYLSQLTEDWKCPECNNCVPIHVGIKGVRRPPTEVVIQCRACNYISPITENGLIKFQEIFRELLNSRWNPKANRFIYNIETDSY